MFSTEDLEMAQLADFGECLECPDGFVVPYNQPISKGGASAYLPPEILAATQGPTSFLDYSKSDEFALGRVFFNFVMKADPYKVKMLK